MKKLKTAVDTGSIEKISAALWQCVCIFSGYPFTTSGRGSRSGVEFTYQVSHTPSAGDRHYGGHSIPGYGNEIWLTVNGEKLSEEDKSGICNMLDNGKLELQEHCKKFLETIVYDEYEYD